MALIIRSFAPVFLFVFLTFILPSETRAEITLDSDIPSYYQADREDGVKERKLSKKDELNEHRRIMQNMSTKTKNLIEFEKKAHVKAFRKAFDTLTADEKQLYKDLRIKLRDNAQKQKKFFETLNVAEKNFLRTPRKRLDPSFSAPEGVRTENVKKFEQFEQERDRLTNKIPKKIMDIELNDQDKLAIHKMRQDVEAEYVKSGQTIYDEKNIGRNTRSEAAAFTGITAKRSDRMR